MKSADRSGTEDPVMSGRLFLLSNFQDSAEGSLCSVMGDPHSAGLPEN